MNRTAVALALLGAACGRANFHECGPPDAPVDTPPATTANIAFVTSTKQLPTTLGSDRSGADAICNARAAAAGLPGTYVAWLSSSMGTARDRIMGSRAWVRTDGKPFVDRVDDLGIGKVYTPLSLDENGDPVVTGDLVLTATYGDSSGGPSCSDFTDPGGQITVGSTSATTVRWTSINTSGCTTPERIYCFGIGKNQPLVFPAATGRRAFLTVQPYNVDAAGIATADALCANEATLAGLTGSYRALLATAGGPAMSRFSLAGPTWVRLDGIPIADSPLALAAASVNAPINLTPVGTYDGGSSVFTGAQFFGSAATSYAFDCNDWTDPAGTSITGLAEFVDTNFYNNTSGTSCFGHPIYCLEE